jgi:hypothetical protein
VVSTPLLRSSFPNLRSTRSKRWAVFSSQMILPSLLSLGSNQMITHKIDDGDSWYWRLRFFFSRRNTCHGSKRLKASLTPKINYRLLLRIREAHPKKFAASQPDPYTFCFKLVMRTVGHGELLPNAVPHGWIWAVFVHLACRYTLFSNISIAFSLSSQPYLLSYLSTYLSIYNSPANITIHS